MRYDNDRELVRSLEDVVLLKDRFDLPVTCAAAAAVEDYMAAIDLLLSAWPGAEVLLDRALAADPEFALAHIARARLLQLQARMPEAKAAAGRARWLADRITARERRHINAIALSIDGAAGDALAIVRAHALKYPRDALPLSLALGVFGLLGFSGRRDHHEAQLALLEELAPHWDNDWWFLGYLGWATSKPARLRGVPRWSSARSPPTRAMPMRRISASMAISSRATRPVAPALSKIGCRVTNGRASCTVTCRGTWRCSSSPATTASAPARSTSAISGRR